MANFNCNAACAVKLTHHFLSRLQSEKLRGALVYTSSPAGFMPCPFSVMYGATKAFLTNFATSLAPEVRWTPSGYCGSFADRVVLLAANVGVMNAYASLPCVRSLWTASTCWWCIRLP